MRFYNSSPRARRIKERRKLRWTRLILPTILIAVALFFYTVNVRLTPIFLQYAEVQTQKIAAHVISEAINARSQSVYDVNDIIENVPNESTGMVTTKFNAEIISRVMSEIHQLVEEHLERAEAGDLSMLPPLGEVEYYPEQMESKQGVVFFVPLGQATNIPLLGNLGPKIPIRFHVLGDVHVDIDTDIREFGINNAYVEASVNLTVNVQIVVPLATQTSVVKQKIPVAIGLIQGTVPQIYSRGDQTPAQIEVPMQSPPAGQ